VARIFPVYFFLFFGGPAHSNHGLPPLINLNRMGGAAEKQKE
jgi:hypothetical protein